MNISREFRPPLSPHYGRLCRPSGRGICLPSLRGKGSGVRSVALAPLVVLALLAAGMAAVYAQSGGGFDLTWNTVDNGGVSFAGGGGYTLGGTAGQADAATWSGGGYTLVGGFWHAASAGAAPGGGKVYLPIIMKNQS
jgi:hypothetical protein